MNLFATNKPDIWEDDDKKKCSLCSQQFTTFKRRHHCRACGKLICGDCTATKTPYRKCYECFAEERKRVPTTVNETSSDAESSIEIAPRKKERPDSFRKRMVFTIAILNEADLTQERLGEYCCVCSCSHPMCRRIMCIMPFCFCYHKDSVIEVIVDTLKESFESASVEHSITSELNIIQIIVLGFNRLSQTLSMSSIKDQISKGLDSRGVVYKITSERKMIKVDSPVDPNALIRSSMATSPKSPRSTAGSTDMSD